MVKILIVNNAEKDISEFCKPLETILLEHNVLFKTVEYRETGKVNISRYDGIILSGSPCGNDIVEDHLPYFYWLLKIDKPVLGICAGHHIIGKLFGANLLRDVEVEIGDFFIFIDDYDPLFAGFEDRILVRLKHHDSITLPADFSLLAHSDHCQVEAMKHKLLPIYSTQFHPEFLNKKLIENFLEITRYSKR